MPWVPRRRRRPSPPARWVGSAVVIVGGGPTERTTNTPMAALLGHRFTVYNDDRGESGDTDADAVERECHDQRRAQ